MLDTAALTTRASFPIESRVMLVIDNVETMTGGELHISFLKLANPLVIYKSRESVPEDRILHNLPSIPGLVSVALKSVVIG